MEWPVLFLYAFFAVLAVFAMIVGVLCWFVGLRDWSMPFLLGGFGALVGVCAGFSAMAIILVIRFRFEPTHWHEGTHIPLVAWLASVVTLCIPLAGLVGGSLFGVFLAWRITPRKV